MTTPIATAYVEIEPVFNNFGPALRRQTQVAAGGFNGLQGSVNGLSGSLKNLGSGAALAGIQAIQTGLIAATTAAIGLATAIATIGIKGASDLANTRLAIGSLGDQLKDVSAEDLVQQLRDLSVQAGVSLGSLTKFEQGFVSLGVSGQDSLAVIEKTLSGLAASGNLSAASLEGVGRALQQIGSKPFLQLEELNQISDQIPAASRVKIIAQLAKQTGDSIAEVQERFRLGTQQSGDALTAVVKVIGALDTSGQALENRTKTIGGAFAKARAEITNSLADVFTPLGEQLAEQLNALDTAGLAAKIGQPIADAFAAIAPEVIAALPDIIEGLALSFQLLAPLVGVAAEGIGALAALIVDNQAQIETFATDLGDFGAGLASLLTGLAPILAGVAQDVADLVSVLGAMGEILQFLEPLWQVLGVTMAASTLPVKAALDAISAVLNLLTGDIDGVTASLTSLANKAITVYNLLAKITPLNERASIGGGGPVSEFDDMGANASAAAISKLIKEQERLNVSANTPVFANTGVGGGGAAASAAKKAAADLARAIATVKKELNGLAKNTSDQSVTEIQRSFDQLVAGLKDAGLKEYVKQVRAVEKTLVGLAKQRDKLNDQLKDAKDNLKSLKTESADFAASIRDTVNDLGNVAQESKGIGTTFNGIRGQMLSAIGTARQFSTAIASLTAAGLNQTSLRQLIEAGPEQGLKSARALLSGGAAGVQEINQLQTQLDAQGKALGASVANTFYAAGIQAAAGLVAGLKSQEAAIDAQMDRIAKRMAAAIKKALQIRSPSALLAREVGKPAGQGIILGLTKEIDRASGVTGAVRNYASNVVNFGPGSVVAHGATEAGANRMGTGLGMGISEVLERQLAQNILNGTG